MCLYRALTFFKCSFDSTTPLLLITFANSLDPDQALQNIRLDLDSDCLTLMIFLKSHENFTACHKELTYTLQSGIMGCKLEQTLNLINFSEDNLFSACYLVIMNQNFEVLQR